MKTYFSFDILLPTITLFAYHQTEKQQNSSNYGFYTHITSILYFVIYCHIVLTWNVLDKAGDTKNLVCVCWGVLLLFAFIVKLEIRAP